MKSEKRFYDSLLSLVEDRASRLRGVQGVYRSQRDEGRFDIDVDEGLGQQTAGALGQLGLVSVKVTEYRDEGEQQFDCVLVDAYDLAAAVIRTGIEATK